MWSRRVLLNLFLVAVISATYVEADDEEDDDDIPPPNYLQRRDGPPPNNLPRPVTRPPNNLLRRDGMPPPNNLKRDATPPPNNLRRRNDIPPPNYLQRRDGPPPNNLPRRTQVGNSHVTTLNNCSADQYPCWNGNCIRREWFCDGGDDCGDSSDERYCNSQFEFLSCPDQYRLCANRKMCYPSVWLCDGTTDCDDGSDERNCESYIRLLPGVTSSERNLTDRFLKIRRQETLSINKWGTQLPRAAVALFLNDRGFFAPGNRTGEEIAYELSLQLLSKLALKKNISTKYLAQFINALIVACIDPKDFFGINVVDELRKHVNSSNHTNPFSILTLCNAKDTMTMDDVNKLQQQYNAHFRPVWTDTQAIAVMAFSCIRSRSSLNFNESILDEMVSELKRKQQKNGAIDNLKTTALVVQALLAAGDYKTDFDLSAAIKFILQEVRHHPNIQDVYYILPIFNTMSLANISSDHCITSIKTDALMEKNLKENIDYFSGSYVSDKDVPIIINLRENPGEHIHVQISIIIGDDMDFSRTWKVKVPRNSTLYQALEKIETLEPAYRAQYSVSEEKPYVVGLGNVKDDSEGELFWFIYNKPLSSTGTPKLIKQSPVDIQVNESEEFILWYRSGFWANTQESPPVPMH